MCSTDNEGGGGLQRGPKVGSRGVGGVLTPTHRGWTSRVGGHSPPWFWTIFFALHDWNTVWFVCWINLCCFHINAVDVKDSRILTSTWCLIGGCQKKNSPDNSLTSSNKLSSTTQKADAVTNVKTAWLSFRLFLSLTSSSMGEGHRPPWPKRGLAPGSPTPRFVWDFC